jgi:Histone methylation protein DOT1
VDALRELVNELDADGLLSELSRFRERCEVLERLDAYALKKDAAIAGEEPEHGELWRSATVLCDKLENTNEKFFEALRDEIRCGAGAKALLPWVRSGSEGNERSCGQAGESYDYLDELVQGVLRFAAPGDAIHALAAEMVAYQPTPARHIFDLIRRLQLSERDVLMDLGAGIGQVPLLAAICTNARTVGIELEKAYVRCARQSAADLNLRKVSFIQQDAREADLSNGTVFYLYSPFQGMMLREVLDLLRQEAARRAIRVCTFGPCTPTVEAEPWLEPLGSLEHGRIAIFHAGR